MINRRANRSAPYRAKSPDTSLREVFPISGGVPGNGDKRVPPDSLKPKHVRVLKGPSILSRECSHVLSLMADDAFPYPTSRSHNGGKALLRGRSVTYFSQMYTFYQHFARRYRRRALPSGIISREREREGENRTMSRRKIASCNQLLLSWRYLLLPTSLYKRPRRRSRNIRGSQIRFPFRPFSTGRPADRACALPRDASFACSLTITHTGRRISRTTRPTVPAVGLVASIAVEGRHEGA